MTSKPTRSPVRGRSEVLAVTIVPDEGVPCFGRRSPWREDFLLSSRPARLTSRAGRPISSDGMAALRVRPGERPDPSVPRWPCLTRPRSSLVAGTPDYVHPECDERDAGKERDRAHSVRGKPVAEDRLSVSFSLRLIVVGKVE